VKIWLVAPPFSGHLHPLLGLGDALRGVADVKVLSTPRAAADCTLPFQPILARHEDAIRAIAEPGREVRGNPWRLYRQLKGNIALLATLKAELTELLDAERPDLVIADFTVPVAGIVAMQRGVRWWTTLPSPCVLETPDGPPAYFGGLTPAATSWQRLQQAVLRQATRLFKRAMHRVFRGELTHIGFPSVYRADGSEAAYSSERILALGIPEIEFPRRHPPQLRFIGAVLHTPHDPTPGPEFPCDGRPAVLVTLGTHLRHAKAGLVDAMRAIAERNPGIQFHFTQGGASGSVVNHAPNFEEHGFISYARHLGRYALVVHHGGAGVLNHCLRQGVPAVVFPHDFDQFDNAARLVAAGVALRVRRPAEIERAVLWALQDDAMKARCKELARVHARHDPGAAIRELLQR
jgi:UDP:flavonoid glycosyltransferase YjiC (YdhE family)